MYDAKKPRDDYDAKKLYKEIKPEAGEVTEPEHATESVAPIGARELLVLGALAAGVGGVIWYSRRQAAVQQQQQEHAAVAATWRAIEADQAAAASRNGHVSPVGVFG
ncbi:MAG: hypothetical protein EPO22_06085 [Dehalococcoidia bacterium]|nr:MAG: hypothetical protein EPO22_06085 [Dehalococcoidia bacterium]